MAKLFFKRDISHSYARKYQKYDVWYVLDLLRAMKIPKHKIDTYGLNTCRYGNVECVAYMIDKGFKDFYHGLNTAAHDGHVGVVKLLLNHGACNVDAGVYFAMGAGQTEVVEMLVNHPDGKWAGNWTSWLGYACSVGNKKMIKLAISHGATHCGWCQGQKHPELQN